MLTEVTGECEHFGKEWLDQLDTMTKEQALEWVSQHIDMSKKRRDAYETSMLGEHVSSEEFPGLLHAWCIDNNNIVRFKRLYDEIVLEG